MHPLDVAILASTALSALLGLWRGLINTILPLLGLFLGMALGRKYGGEVSSLIFGSSAGWQGFLGFIIIVTAISILTMILARLLRKILSFLMLGWLDRVAGMAVGLIIALLSWSFILVIAYQLPGLKEFIQGSAIASFLLHRLAPKGTVL